MGHTPTTLGPPPDPRNFAWRDYGLRVGIWRLFDLADQLGLPLCHLINSALGKHAGSVFGVLQAKGGIAPPLRKRSARALTLEEREEISRGLVAGYLSARSRRNSAGRLQPSAVRSAATAAA
jgi:hypothetical protein